jgi:selenocysteine lyase/cysteine desulfurase
LRTQLAGVPGVVVRDTGARRSGIVTFDVDGHDADDVVARLNRARVNTSVSRAESARLDLPRRGVGDVVRASVHYYNTDDELALLVSLLDDLVAGRAG